MDPIKITEYHYDDRLLNKPASSVQDVLVYRFPETAIVLGRASKVEEEVFLEPAVSDKMPIYRRKGGGCSVILDPGNVIIALSFLNTEQRTIPQLFAHCSQHIIDILRLFKMPPVEQKGISDLTIGDRKIGGACLYISKSNILYSISLLVDAKIELMERYLRHPPREPDYRKGRSHREFVTTLRSHNQALTTEHVIGELKKTVKPIAG